MELGDELGQLIREQLTKTSSSKPLLRIFLGVPSDYVWCAVNLARQLRRYKLPVFKQDGANIYFIPLWLSQLTKMYNWSVHSGNVCTFRRIAGELKKDKEAQLVFLTERLLLGKLHPEEYAMALKAYDS